MNPALRDLFLGGEDEEVQDFTTPEERRRGRGGAGAGSYLDIDIRRNADGSATVRYLTNDRDGDGRPDRETGGWNELLVAWEERSPSAAEAQRTVGRSRVEPTGRVVSVYLDGERLA